MKPFEVFTPGDMQALLEVYHRTGNWAFMADRANAILNERGLRIYGQVFFEDHEALMLGQRRIEK